MITLESNNTTEYYHANEFEECCSECESIFRYDKVFGNKILTGKDYHSIKCPDCGVLIMPCDLCHDVFHNDCDCTNCPIEIEEQIR